MNKQKSIVVADVDVKEFCEMFNKPEFSIKGAQKFNDEITYRKINNWESKGLITPSRKTPETGWRKFTFIDMIKLFIISDLKKIGLESSSIEKILQGIEKYDTEKIQKNIKNKDFGRDFQMSVYEIVIHLTMIRYKAFLLISNQNTVKLVFTLGDNAPLTMFQEILQNPKEMMDEISENSSIVLPLRPYIAKVFSLWNSDTQPAKADPAIESSDPRIKYVEAFIEDARLEAIMAHIRNKDYEELMITKLNGEQIQITAKTTINGKFSNEEILKIFDEKGYRNVAVITRDGQRIGFERREITRI